MGFKINICLLNIIPYKLMKKSRDRLQKIQNFYKELAYFLIFKSIVNLVMFGLTK